MKSNLLNRARIIWGTIPHNPRAIAIRGLQVAATITVLALLVILLVSAGGCSTAPMSMQTSVPYTSIVISESMLPLLQVSAEITVVPFDYDALQAGQVAAYRPYFSRSAFNYVHQLKEKRGDWWVMQGINNAKPDDSFMTRENFVGLVVIKKQKT